MTFRELILDCAERWGVADETGTRAGIPTDLAVLDKVKRKINAGYADFLRADPRWTFLRQRVQVTWYPDGDGPYNINGDASRYRLPSYVGSAPLTDWTYVDAGAPPSCILTVDGERVRMAAARQVATGVPTWAGCIPLATEDGVGGQSKGWEVVFYPRPSTAYTVEAMFRVGNHVLAELGERHVAGSDHDRTIIAYADHHWFKDDAETPDIPARYEAEMLRNFGASVQIDKQRRPRNHGKLIDPSVMRNPVNRSSNLGTLTFDGAAIS